MSFCYQKQTGTAVTHCKMSQHNVYEERHTTIHITALMALFLIFQFFLCIELTLYIYFKIHRDNEYKAVDDIPQLSKP